MSRASRMLVAAMALGLAVGMQSGALAAVIDNVDLDGLGPTIWDPEIAESGCDSTDVYSPAQGGSFGAAVDAFDGSLTMTVNAKPFDDPDGNGNESGESLKVGPETVAGLKVTSTATALGTSPTLQYLVKFKNGKSKDLKRTIVMDTNLGSDAATVDETTSSGDTLFSPADRWVVTSDGVVGSDPVVTHALYGKGHPAEKVVGVTKPPEDPAEPDCVIVAFKIKVPAGSTVYLLFFLQMHAPGAAGLAGMDAAGLFNDKNLSAPLLTGLSNGVREKILNWALA